MVSKTKLIGTATTLTLTSVLIWIALNQSFVLKTSGDMTCSGVPQYSDLFKTNISDCQIFWNITSKDYTYYFRNKNGNKLGFSPEVDGYEWFVKDGRFKSGYRPMDKSGNFTFYKGKEYQFMAFIFKSPTETIKWSITAAEQNVDPILYGINLSVLCSYEDVSARSTVYYEDLQNFSFTCPSGFNATADTINKIGYCFEPSYINSNGTSVQDLNFSHYYNRVNQSLRTMYWTEIKHISYVEIENSTKCNRIGFRDETRNRNFYCAKCDFNCYRQDNFIYMVSNNDADSGCRYDIETGKAVCKFDTPSMRKQVKEKCYEVED